jgi:hypothetical protein
MQRERYRRTAEEERKLKNVIRERFAEEERKLKNVCLTVTDICEGGKVAAVKVKAPLCCFEGCNNQIRAGGVCSRHGAKQTRTCSKKGCTKQAQLRGVCVAHGARTKRCSHAGCTKQVVRGGKCKDHAGPVACRNISWFVQHRGVPQQWCLDKSEQNVGLQELPLHESHWKGSILGCKYTRTNVQL